VYSKGWIGISASLFLEFIKPPYGIAKNKREICKDKQILMISRFYKPAFVTLFFFGLIINEREEEMQEKNNMY